MEPRSFTICDIVDALQESSARSAIVDLSNPGSGEYSRQQLLQPVRRLAGGLVAAGITRGDVVALVSDNRVEWIIAALAIMRSGATVLPIDTQTGEANLCHLLEDSQARLLFCNNEQLPRLHSLALDKPPQLLQLDCEEGEHSWRSLLAEEGNALPLAEPADIAILFYTSGTTGPPKGVPLSHGNITFQLREIKEVGLMHDGDRVLLPLPLHHVYPFVIGMLVPLYLKLPIILPKSLTGPDILQAIREGRATTILGVPRLYRALVTGIQSQVVRKGLLVRLYFNSCLAISTQLRQGFGISLGKYLLRPLHRQFGPSLRLLASGGSSLDAELARQLEGLGWEVAIGYGLTETSPLLTLNLPGSAPLASVGRPLPGVAIKIEKDADAPNGELLVKGPNVFKGYWKLPEKTRNSFSEDGWFRTGDLAFQDKHGFLYLQGRSSTVIVTESGKNIQPDEVEEHYAAHPCIAEIGVLGEEGQLVALIIPDTGEIRRRGLEEAEALKLAVAEQGRTLPSYQRLSRYRTSREALPRTRLGKIRRHKLQELYRLAKPEQQGATRQGGPVDLEDMADRDQELIARPEAGKVWRWLVQHYPDVRLSPDTLLALELNIDSIEMINLSLEIKHLTEVDLSDKTLSRLQTVRDLLDAVVHARDSDAGGLDLTLILEQPEAFLSDEQQRWHRPLGPLQSLVPRLAHLLFKGLLRSYSHFQVRGLENLPRDRPFVLIPNHASMLDPVVILAALPYSLLRRTFFAGWAPLVFKNKAWRLVARLGQTIPVDPENATASSLALGAKILKDGYPMVWFPEGERTADGKLKAFKPGIGLLLSHYPVAAVPVCIKGTYQSMPKGAHWPRRHPIIISFGKVIEPLDLVQDDSDSSRQNQISRGLHEQLQIMMDKQEA